MPQPSVAHPVATPDDQPSAPSGADATRVNPAADISGAVSIAEHRVGHRAVLSVAGEVDICTADDLRAAIETAAARVFEIWVDLSETTFMDSSGLHALAQARTRLADANLRLALICPDGPVLRVLKLTGFDRLFEIHASRSEANYAAGA
jgi:anti-sigma B factor antagonist